jgi:hypothetical protein
VITKKEKTMEYAVLTQKINETLENIIKGYRLRVAVVKNNKGEIMLKVALMDWGGYEVSFFTDSRYLALPRVACANYIPKLQIELSAYYGNECDLVYKYNKGVFSHFALFDVSKVWEELNYPITRGINLTQMQNEIAEWIK